MNQALTNLLQNAADAIEAAEAAGSLSERGSIRLRVCDEEGRATVMVEDDGIGLPAALRDRLTEPYITTRSTGTRLGLAIGNKIMGDRSEERSVGKEWDRTGNTCGWPR